AGGCRGARACAGACGLGWGRARPGRQPCAGCRAAAPDLGGLRGGVGGRDGGSAMRAFSADWLTAREPHDARARNQAVLDALADAVADKSPIRVVDLGCGTGATLRALACRLPVPQHWRLLDNDLG